MMIVYGGRKDNKGFHEIWGLRRHRNGTWDWTKPPKEMTTNGRY